MGINYWFAENWFGLIQTSALALGLILIGAGVFLEARARRIGNLIQLTRDHRELWERMYADPQLARILDPAANLVKVPVTAEEELFVVFIILHLSSTYYAMRAGFFQKPQCLKEDIEIFFSLPIPRAVWATARDLQDKPFVSFVEKCFPRLCPLSHDETDERNVKAAR